MTNIPLKMLKQMFKNMRDKSGWDTDAELLWGYFFTDPNPEKLNPIAEHLKNAGYRIVKIYRTDDRSTNFLHVERIEHHTPASLHRRNGELQSLAESFSIESYDGMDVGPVK